MSIEDRLYALVAQARQAQGDSVLRMPGQLVPRLTGQAPDLHGEIRALAAALAMDAPRSIAAAADGAAETARIATEIAAGERLSIGVVNTAITVACRIGATSTGPAAAPVAAGGWAGDSVAVGATPSPAPIPAAAPAETAATAAPWFKNRWIGGAMAAGVLFFVYLSSQRDDAPQAVPPGPGQQGQYPPGQMPSGQMPSGQMPPGQMPPPGQTPMPPGQQPQPGPMAGTNGAPVGQQQGEPPLLQPPGGNLPAISVQRTPEGAIALGFRVQTRGGGAPGIVILPANGWESGPTMFGFMRAGGATGGQPDTMGTGIFRLVPGQSPPVRTAQPSWQQDNVGMGNICVAFIGAQPGQDVGLQGSTMCVMDASCQQAAGCGRMP